MDAKITQQIKDWLYKDEPKDVEKGSMLLLRITGNRILYQNILRNPNKYLPFLEHQLQKQLKFRLANVTHEEVKVMSEKVAIIAAKNKADEFKAGKRADHDELPDEIQAVYAENLDIVHKMRELHLQLRKLSESNLTCPDSERFPFLKEIIELDKKLHRNWEIYDNYTSENGQELMEKAQREADLKTVRQINLAKGRYKRNPSETLRATIADLFNSLKFPNEQLAQELRELKIIG